MNGNYKINSEQKSKKLVGIVMVIVLVFGLSSTLIWYILNEKAKAVEESLVKVKVNWGMSGLVDLAISRATYEIDKKLQVCSQTVCEGSCETETQLKKGYDTCVRNKRISQSDADTIFGNLKVELESTRQTKFVYDNLTFDFGFDFTNWKPDSERKRSLQIIIKSISYTNGGKTAPYSTKSFPALISSFCVAAEHGVADCDWSAEDPVIKVEKSEMPKFKQ
jgi:hypothetical protein